LFKIKVCRFSCLKQHQFTRAPSVTRSALGFSLVQYKLATNARGVQGACPARGPAAALRARYRHRKP
jgi:hypothetical protein